MQNPHLSIRHAIDEAEAICRFPLSRGSLHGILKKLLKLKFRRPLGIQELHIEDFDDSRDFGENILKGIIDIPDFLSLILWSDESIFQLYGRENRHNVGTWSRDNQFEIAELPLHDRPS